MATIAEQSTTHPPDQYIELAKDGHHIVPPGQAVYRPLRPKTVCEVAK